MLRLFNKLQKSSELVRSPLPLFFSRDTSVLNLGAGWRQITKHQKLRSQTKPRRCLGSAVGNSILSNLEVKSAWKHFMEKKKSKASFIIITYEKSPLEKSGSWLWQRSSKCLLWACNIPLTIRRKGKRQEDPHWCRTLLRCWKWKTTEDFSKQSLVL